MAKAKAMTATSTTIERILKELYPERKLEYMLYDKAPFLGMIPKDTDFVGDSKRISLITDGIAGRSADFTTAQTNRAGAGYDGFNLRPKTDSAIFGITTLALRQSKKDQGALVKGLNTETKTAITKLKQSISRSCYGNGGGAIGQIASGGGTAALTLVNTDDIVHFERREYLQHATTDGTSGAVGVTAQEIIESVDRDNGVIGFAAPVAAGFADGQYLFHAGDFGAKLSGIQGWVPPTTPTATPFLGVDRSSEPTRLGGQRFTASRNIHGTLQRAFVKAGARLNREGGDPDSLFLNPEDFATMLNDVGDKTRFEKMPGKTQSGKAVIAYNALCVQLPGGEVKVYADKHCPKGRAFLLQMNTWQLCTAGKAPSWLDEDGKMFLREGSADALQGRMAMYGDIACYAPGYNMTIDISAFSDQAA